IQGPGMCGADFPLRVTMLGEGGPLGFADDPRPPGAIPRVQEYPPPASAAAPAYPAPSYRTPSYGAAAPTRGPMPITPEVDEPPVAGPEPYGQPYPARPGYGAARDWAAFTLAEGRKVTVREGWRGAPEERAFLHDVHASACRLFATVLAPGSNAFHSDHMHVDLARHGSGRAICEPRPIPGD